jgi:hypothetical protein
MKISKDVLKVLSDLRFDGPHARIAAQLDRKLYLKVDEALKACGGKWNRKEQAHVFGEDAEPIVDAAVNAGEVRTAKDDGFFPTPPDLARRLVALAEVGPRHFALEPSAGEGSIVKALLDEGAYVVAVEVDRKRADALPSHPNVKLHVRDFMTYENGKFFDRVVRNPLFCKVGLGDHLDHVKRAHSLLASRGVLVSVLPSSIEFREDSRHREFRAWYEALGGVAGRLPECSFKASGTNVSTVVLRMTA